MPKSSVSEYDPNANYPIPEDTLVPITLQSCEFVSVPYKDKKTGADKTFAKWEWTFLVHDGDYAGTTFRGSTEPRITSSEVEGFPAPALPIVKALLNRDLAIGEEVDTDELIGLQAQATVRHLDPRPRKQGDGFWYNVELAEIFPAYGQNVTGQSAQPQYTSQIPY